MIGIGIVIGMIIEVLADLRIGITINRTPVFLISRINLPKLLSGKNPENSQNNNYKNHNNNPKN
jgi:hypothetical protein